EGRQEVDVSERIDVSEKHKVQSKIHPVVRKCSGLGSGISCEVHEHLAVERFRHTGDVRE
ncbi:hypothetical protein L915_12910, partial [Phytophthora nicotianae]